MRVSVGSNEYRTVLFAIDNSNVILSTKIILLNGFLKKSTKDYDKQMKNTGNMVQLLVNLSMKGQWRGIMVIYFGNVAKNLN